MKIFLFILLLNFSGHDSFSQENVIQFFDGNNPVPKVTVVDSARNLIWQSDENGKVYLSNKEYNLIITHVSFNVLKINLAAGKNEIPLRIQLTPKISSQLPVILKSKRPNQGNYFYKTKQGNREIKRGFYKRPY